MYLTTNKSQYPTPKTMKSPALDKFIHFLREELAIPSSAISLALRHQEESPNLLPMTLWQYGLISLEQLDRIFDWLETAQVTL